MTAAIGAALVLSILVEAIIEYFLDGVPSNYKPWVSAGIGIVLSLAYGIDAIGFVLAQLGTDPSPLGQYSWVVGSILTGIVISRGSNFFNDLISRLRGELPASALVEVHGEELTVNTKEVD